MTTNGIRWTRAAKAVGGLAAVFTLLAHFWLPTLPLTVVRVELLLFLIGILLGVDMLTENFPVSIGIETGSNHNEGHKNGTDDDTD